MRSATDRRMPAPRRLRSRQAIVRSRLLSRRIQRMAQSSAPIVAGPWVLDAGLELLYWIPFLNWLTSRAGVDPQRIVAVSRAGADSWYADVAGSYVDLLDHFSAEDVRRWGEERALHPGGRGGSGVRDREQRAFELARDALGDKRAEWLEPALLYGLLDPYWRWLVRASVVGTHTVHRTLPDDGGPASGLPQPYVALDAHFDSTFPDTPENRRFVETLVGAIGRHATVVPVRVPAAVPGTEPYELQADELPEGAPTPTERRSLVLQTEIVRHADVFVSAYGGLSYLGPYVGTPTIAFYSHGRLDVAHLDVIDRIGRRLGGDRRLFRARHAGQILAGQAHDAPSGPNGGTRA